MEFAGHERRTSFFLLKSHKFSLDLSDQRFTIEPTLRRCWIFQTKCMKIFALKDFRDFSSNKSFLYLLQEKANHNEIKQKIRTQTSNHEWWSRKSCWNVLPKTKEQSGEWILKHKSLSSLFMYFVPWISKSTAYLESQRVFS